MKKLILKYLVGAYFIPYDSGHGISFMGKSSGQHYSLQEVRDWLKDHKIKFTELDLTNWVTKSKPISYIEYLNWNKTLPTQDRTNSANKFQWNNKYWAKIGNSHKGIKTPEEYSKYFDEWFKTSGINPKYRDEVFKKNWELYLKLGFSKLPSSTNTEDMTGRTNISSGGDGSTVVSEEEEPQYLNGMKYIYQDGKFTLVPEQSTIDQNKNGQTPEVEATKTEVTTPTIDPYLKIIEMNQLAFKNGKGSSRFNRDFRQAFTTALASGDLYNKETGLGSQVFDLGGDWTAEKMLGYITPGKGLTRKGMRRMIKDYNSPSAESINNGINRFFGFNPNASPAQTNLSVINGLEPVVATINGQVANNVNSFGFDKANYYPNTLNGFNGTSDIDPNAAYRAELEKRNAINLLNRS